MRTSIERFESSLGKAWAVVDRGTEELEYVEFSTKKRAVVFKQMVSKLPGDTIQAKFDAFVDGLVASYVGMGLEPFAAFHTVGEYHV